MDGPEAVRRHTAHMHRRALRPNTITLRLAVLRRFEIHAGKSLLRVTIDDVRLPLTPKEYRLLQILAQHAGNVVTHQILLKEIWGQPHMQDTHYLRIFVRKLRQKIEADATRPKILLTELGVGYRLAMSSEMEAGAAGNP